DNALRHHKDRYVPAGTAKPRAGHDLVGSLHNIVRDVGGNVAHATSFRFWRWVSMYALTAISFSGQSRPRLPRLPTLRRRSNSRPLPTARQKAASLMPVSARNLSISDSRSPFMRLSYARICGYVKCTHLRTMHAFVIW